MDLHDVESADLTFNFDIPVMPTTSTADVLDFDFSAGASSLKSITNMLNTSPDYEDQMALQRTYTQVKRPLSAGHLSAFAKSRVKYSIEQMKLMPRIMVKQNSTPWAHSMLYDEHMPRSLQDAHAACALYITKNSTNAEHVVRYITSPLMLYQIMLVFGGDVRFYAHAETLLPYLEGIRSSLQSIAAGQTDTSVRCTILSLYHITVIYTLLSGQFNSCAHELAFNNRSTISAQLWNAKNAFHFLVAWNEKNHCAITELDFTEVLKHAQPDDLDVFSRMMLVRLQRMDDMRGWFYTRGGTL
ncbi:hypothetical protein EJ02DRAFT_448744 [Clathrospora elynae]|uniref:Transcription factor domain-containing protein n=1 Tax=Clathrospora elynae TaxID=706981 RepID=A0A6A5S5P9_9PLEO|nr:hypothetical protein EJ02DRAFT_448744 [Clathrospora elynae]